MEEQESVKVETPKKVRYKSTKGADDKRRQVSLLNLAKARQKKLEQLKAKKDVQEYDIGSETESDSSSSDEEIIITKKNKDKKKPTSKSSGGDEDRLSRLENMISNLVNKKEHKPRRVIEKRTVIQLPPQQQQGGYNNPQRQQLLNLI